MEIVRREYRIPDRKKGAFEKAIVSAGYRYSRKDVRAWIYQGDASYDTALAFIDKNLVQVNFGYIFLIEHSPDRVPKRFAKDVKDLDKILSDLEL